MQMFKVFRSSLTRSQRHIDSRAGTKTSKRVLTTMQSQTNASITTYPSPYMDAKDTPLTTLYNGACVGEDTATYFTLPPDSPERASYDNDIVKEVAAGVWTIGSKSIVNVNVVEGPQGLIVYDTGDSYQEGKHFYSLLRTQVQTPIRAIVYSHEHYAKGAQAFLDGEKAAGNTNIAILGHPHTNVSMARTGGLAAMYPEVSSVLLARSLEQFNSYLPDEGADAGFKNTIPLGASGFVPVDTPVEDGLPMNLAGLEVEFYTEGIATDTANQVLMWVPSKRIILSNVLWGWFPNIYSARGGKFRDPSEWMASLDFMREFEAEILLNTHSTPVVGVEVVSEKLLNYRDGIAYVRDQTLKGILLGEGPDELRYSVQLPTRLVDEPWLIQNYGEVESMAPRIFTATFGQFDRNATTLNKLHPEEEAQRMVVAMDGEESARGKAQEAYANGDYLWACQIADYLVRANDVQVNRQLKADCLRQMAYRALSTNTRSWYLTQARQLEGHLVMQKSPATPDVIERNAEDYVNYYRVRVNGDKSQAVDKLLGVKFDEKRCYGLHVRDSVVDFVRELGEYERVADVTVLVSAGTWCVVFNNVGEPGDLIDNGSIGVAGDPILAKEIFALFDPVYFV